MSGPRSDLLAHVPEDHIEAGDYLREQIEFGQHVHNGGDVPEPWGDEAMVTGYSRIQIPAGLICYDDREIWRRIVAAERLGAPPQSDVEAVVRLTRAGVIASGLGRRTSPSVVMAGVLLAIAKHRGIRIETPLRGIALHIGVKYQTLLQVRRAALAVIKKHRVELGFAIA